MGFWVFMLLMDLMIPGLMIFFGWMFVNNPPEKINSIYGYRTSSSMKSQETWDFAHQYYGKIWKIMGLIFLPLTIIPMLFVIGKGEDAVALVGGVVCGVSCIAMILPIIPTEMALHKNFDENGVRK